MPQENHQREQDRPQLVAPDLPKKGSIAIPESTEDKSAPPVFDLPIRQPIAIPELTEDKSAGRVVEIPVKPNNEREEV